MIGSHMFKMIFDYGVRINYPFAPTPYSAYPAELKIPVSSGATSNWVSNFQMVASTGFRFVMRFWRSSSESLGCGGLVMQQRRMATSSIEVLDSGQPRTTSKQAILEHLAKDELRNVSIINLIKSGYDFECVKVGDSILFRFKGELAGGHNLRISSSSAAEMKELLRFMKRDDRMFAAVDSWLVPIIADHVRVTSNDAVHKYYLPETSTLPEPSIEIAPIKVEDARTVNDTWPFRDAFSYRYFRKIVEAGFTAAVYDDDKMVAWGLINDDGSIGALRVLDGHRGRHYAYDIVVTLAKRIKAEGKVPYLFVAEGNEPAKKLVESIGFEESGMVSWVDAE